MFALAHPPGSQSASWGARGASRLTVRVAVALALAAALLPPSAAAADRTFELVTAPGGDATSTAFESAQPDGSWVYWSVPQGSGVEPYGAKPDGSKRDLFGTHRTASGWQGEWLTPYCMGDGNVNDGANCLDRPSEQGVNRILAAHDGRVAFVTLDAIDPTDPPVTGGLDLYVSDAKEGARLVSGGPGGWAQGVGASSFAASSDLGTLVFHHFAPLVPEDLDDSEDLYVFRGDGPSALATPVPGCTSECGGVSDIAPLRRPVSDDGQTVFVQTDRVLDPLLDTDGQGEDVYAITSEGTRLMSSNTPGSTEMSKATPDGSTVYWVTEDQAIGDDGDTAQDVYATDVATGAVSLVSRGGVADVPAGFTAVSDDGSRVFFATAEDIPGTGAPADGLRKLYAVDGGPPVYVESFNPSDPMVEVSSQGGWGPIAVATDGSSAVFSSTTKLLDEDPNGVEDVYRWTLDAGVRLISARPAGQEAAGAVFRTRTALSSLDRFGPGITADGEHAFFETKAALLQADADGGRTDVYEWEEGSGLSLVSPEGSGPYDASYRSNSADGVDVFIHTDEPISGWDADGYELDIYDARIGGGLPEPTPSGPPVGGPADPGVGAGTPPAFPSETSAPGTDDFRSPRVSGVALRARTLRARAGRVRLRLAARASGLVRVRLRTRPGALVIARGSKRFPEAGAGTVTLRLTATGRRHARRGGLRAWVVGTFKAADGSISDLHWKVAVKKGRRNG
jgi:hypothetical protein